MAIRRTKTRIKAKRTIYFLGRRVSPFGRPSGPPKAKRVGTITLKGYTLHRYATSGPSGNTWGWRVSRAGRTIMNFGNLTTAKSWIAQNPIHDAKRQAQKRKASRRATGIILRAFMKGK
jgi:hypothetical protein